MADVAVDTGIQTSFESAPRRIGLVWTDEDTGYVVFTDNVLNDTWYRKTTDGGANWAAAVLVDLGSRVSGIDVWFDKWTPGDSGTLLHIWWMDSNNDTVQYRTLDTSDDSLGTLSP